MEPFNIDIIGPGAWYIIHIMAAKAKTSDEIKSFHILVKMISESFFCDRCRHHFRNNVKECPPPNSNDANELFAWTVTLHNKVNQINDKELVDYIEALDFYIGRKSRCSGDCGAVKSGNLRVSEMILHTLKSGDRIKYISSDINSL